MSSEEVLPSLKEYEIQEIVLNIERMGALRKIPLRYVDVDRVEFSCSIERCMGEMVLSIDHYVATQQLERIEVKYPADWWQHLKQRWYPIWAIKRWPVKYTCQQMEAKALYPKIALPNKDPYVVMRVMKPYLL